MLIQILMSPYITDSLKALGCENCYRENLKDVRHMTYEILLIPVAVIAAGCLRMPACDGCLLHSKRPLRCSWKVAEILSVKESF